MTALIYGTGMRIHECLSLRIKDIDFNRAQITVRASKGHKDRMMTLLPSSLAPFLRQHKSDCLQGDGFAPCQTPSIGSTPLLLNHLPGSMSFRQLLSGSGHKRNVKSDGMLLEAHFEEHLKPS